MSDDASSMQPGFTPDRAKSYDTRVRKHIPGYELIHDLSETLLTGELPEKASILVVGTGTGVEIIEWGAKHPQWTFLGTDTAPGMLALAQEKIEAAGMSDRVRLHAGDVQELAEENFDAAALMLVLHFVPNFEKLSMLSAIAERLNPGAPFLLANLFGDPQTTRFKRLTAARKAWAISNGIEPALAEQFCDPTRPDMHIVPEENIKALLREAGLIDVQRVFQALTVGLWLSRTHRP